MAAEQRSALRLSWRLKSKGARDDRYRLSQQNQLAALLPARQGSKNEHEILRIFESDRGRIINSAAIRRLQQKTQVFPLERNAAVRTRLTHSLEVQQVGRYIAKEVLTRLQEAGRLGSSGWRSSPLRSKALSRWLA